MKALEEQALLKGFVVAPLKPLVVPMLRVFRCICQGIDIYLCSAVIFEVLQGRLIGLTWLAGLIGLIVLMAQSGLVRFTGCQ